MALVLTLLLVGALLILAEAVLRGLVAPISKGHDSKTIFRNYDNLINPCYGVSGFESLVSGLGRLADQAWRFRLQSTPVSAPGVWHH